VYRNVFDEILEGPRKCHLGKLLNVIIISSVTKK